MTDPRISGEEREVKKEGQQLDGGSPWDLAVHLPVFEDSA